MNPIEFRAHRLALGLNQATLADLIGVKQNTVSRWEKGAAPVPEGVAHDLLAMGERLDALAESCTAQGRDTGAITVLDDPAQPMANVLLVAAARAQAALRAQGIDATVIEQDPQH